MGAVDPSMRAVSTSGGQILRAATGLVAARPAGKPLHPRGSLSSRTLSRFGGEERTGAAWLDNAGRDDVLVRVSRAVGLPSAVPDVHGLAVRAPTAHGHGDLSFASTSTE